MEFFITPNSKNIIATLRTVTIEKSDLTFLLTLYFYDNIINRYIPDIAETLNSPLMITLQNSPNHHTVRLNSTSGKSFPRSLACIIDKGCEVSIILIFMVPFDM